MSKISDLFINEKLTVAEAMASINSNNCGIVFIVDEHNLLKGCVTDGDIRRFILANGNISSCVTEAMNADPIVANNHMEAMRLYHVRNYKAIPIVDNNRAVVDIYVGENEIQEGKAQLGIPVVINAGGRGTRLDPYTKVLPKPLIPVGEYPIIELIMQKYESYGCNDFNIIVNYKKNLIKAYFADEEKTHRITWYDEQVPLGTGGGLSLLKGQLEGTFFFANCDALLTADFEDVLKFHKENQNLITMICASKSLNIPYGVIEVGDNGVIESMQEKPVMSFLTNTGIYVVEPEVLNYVENNVSIGFPDIAKKVMDSGGKVSAYTINEDEWMDMGQIPELEKMRIRLCGE